MSWASSGNPRQWELKSNKTSLRSFPCHFTALGTTGDQHARGNWGYLDQVATLRWVQQNIIYFGGNPDHVTISVKSASGTSVSSHVLSPMSQGLFHSTVMESGMPVLPDLISNTSEVIYKVNALSHSISAHHLSPNPQSL